MLLNEFEQKYWPELVMGIDEAGRGPLCGPLSVACCVLPPFYENELINDSKKLTAKKRDLLYEQIINDALYFKVILVSPQRIDEINILNATKEAMSELALSYECAIVLTDATKLNIDQYHEAIIKGDAKSISIAAASILAKVTRDRYMEDLAKQYPQYELDKHKGYPTKRHLELIEEYGIQDFYRKSYGPVKRLLN